MLRRVARGAVLLGVAGAMLAPAIASNATEVSFVNPTNGCTYHVYGPTVTVTTLPTPGVHKTGGVGESVDCP